VVVELKKHNPDIYHAVAILHAKHINKGFLSSLGIPFLALLYESIDADECSVLLVEKVDGEVVGYVSGTSSMGAIYKQLLMRFPRLLWALLPAMFSPSRICKIIEVLLFTKKGKLIVNVPDEELLSIVVDPSQQGQGTAKKLFVNLCRHFKSNGASEFRIVVGKSLNRAHGFYSKLGSKPVGEIVVHKGESSIVYVKGCI
jgi:ribosomal protein S18 acetylase RimI-like enzyme